MKQAARMRRKEHEDRSVLLDRTVAMKIVCPDCEVENPGYQSNCWHCGKNLTGVECTANSGHSPSIQRTAELIGTVDLVVTKTTTHLTPSQTTAHLPAKQTIANRTGRQTIIEWIECPNCKVDNSRYQSSCWHCGESLIGVEGSTTDPGDASPAPTIDMWERIILPPEKPVSRLQLGFSIGIFLLIILGGSIIFQVLQPVSRILFIAGIVSGFGVIYSKTINPSSTSTAEASDPSKSPIPEWLALPIGLIFLLILVIFMFGWEYVIEFFFSQDPGERFLALGLGLIFGGIIEYFLDYLLQVIAHLKMS